MKEITWLTYRKLLHYSMQPYR